MRRLSGFLPMQSVYADFEQALEWYNRQDVTLGG